MNTKTDSVDSSHRAGAVLQALPSGAPAVRELPAAVDELLTALERTFSVCPLRPLYTVHTAEEMDRWWMERNADNAHWVRITAINLRETLIAANAVTPATAVDAPNLKD